MSAIVIELQKDALSANTSVSDLLRKALVVSRKLQISEFESWIRQELNGYDDKRNAPPYRNVQGQLKAQNPYSGLWCDVIFNDPGLIEKLIHQVCGQSIAEIENLLEQTTQSNYFMMKFPSELSASLAKGMEWGLHPVLHVPKTALHGILDAVRNTILEWTLKLEENNVLGEGLTFSSEEKQAASNVTFNIGTMHHSQIQNDALNSNQILTAMSSNIDIEQLKALIESIKDSMSQLQINADQKVEMEQDIATVEAQISSTNPKKSIIWESLGSVKRILEGAAGGAVGSQLASQIANLLG